MSRASSVGKVDDCESGGSQVQMSQQPSEKNLLVLLDKTLYLRVVLDNDNLLSVDYENGMLKNLIAALESEYTIYTKLRRTKSIKLLK